MVCSVQLEALQQPSQAQAAVVVEAAPDELYLKKKIRAKLAIKSELYAKIFAHENTDEAHRNAQNIFHSYPP